MDILVFQPMSERTKMKCVSVECFVYARACKALNRHLANLCAEFANVCQ
jgi:hypothetical protein